MVTSTAWDVEAVGVAGRSPSVQSIAVSVVEMVLEVGSSDSELDSLGGLPQCHWVRAGVVSSMGLAVCDRFHVSI